jgi:hypothetical protein
MLEQRLSAVPRHRRRPLDDVVTQRAHRDEAGAVQAEAGGPVEHLARDRAEAFLGVADEVHLVDEHGHARHPAPPRG